MLALQFDRFSLFRFLFIQLSWFIFWLGCLFLGLFLQHHLRVNLSASMPRGVYWITNAEPQRGNFVIVCLPKNLAQFGLQRGYLHSGSCSSGVEPLLKKVVGIANDRITLLNNSVLINDKPLPHSTTLQLDSSNRFLPSIQRKDYTLKANQVWVYGIGSVRSWDSRYFGAIDRSCILSVVKPLLLFSGV